MSIDRRPPRDVTPRLRHRLQQRYLRWLVMQPAESIFLSDGWRSFCRTGRRRAKAFFGSRLVITPLLCLAACGVLLILGLVAILLACVVRFLPDVFFSAPEHSSFVDSSQRAAVAMTRLTIFQSAMLPLLFVWASCCFRSPVRLDTRVFYKKHDRLRLVGYRIGFIGFLACSVAVALGATLGHDASGYGAAGSLAATGCWGWLAWTVGKRLMAVRWPPRMSSPAVSVAQAFVLITSIFFIPAALRLCYGPAVLSISQYLQWLGPLGWVNAQLHGLSHGQMQSWLPIGVFCAVTAYLGYRLDGPTRSWAFRRRLLAIYRSREYWRQRTSIATGEQRVACDLRQVLSGNIWPTWKSILYPRWMVGHAASLILIGGVFFAFQLIFAGIVLFLEAIENESGQALHEKLMVIALLSSVGGWNVLLTEVFAACFRDLTGLSEFARRPVSPGDVWRQLQREGLKLAPTQILYSVPFVILTAVLAPAYTPRCCVAVGAALIGCVAFRTTLCAGACYSTSIVMLRQWPAAVLQTVGTIAGVCLIVGTISGVMIVGVKPDLTFGGLAVHLLALQVATLTALAIARGCWYAVGRERNANIPTSKRASEEMS